MKLIDIGKVKNQAYLSKKIGISETRVTKILNLLKLDQRIIDNLKRFGI